MTIYEDSRVVSRADLAAWLHQLASQLESGGRIFYGAGGMVAVADQVRCQWEIEQENGTEMSAEIEFTWAVEKPAGHDAASDEPEAPPDGEEADANSGTAANEPEVDTAASAPTTDEAGSSS